jgi:hypothetical protein
MGWPGEPSRHASFEANEFTVDEAKAVAERLGMDNITYVLRAPIYAKKVEGKGGTLFYGEGFIHTAADLPMVQLPDPYDDALYAEAESFVKNKGQYSAWFITRIGIAPAMLSMGIEEFSLALYDDRNVSSSVCSTSTLTGPRSSLNESAGWASTSSFRPTT